MHNEGPIVYNDKSMRLSVGHLQTHHIQTSEINSVRVQNALHKKKAENYLCRAQLNM